jgi:hypothetical protein
MLISIGPVTIDNFELVSDSTGKIVFRRRILLS